MLTPLFLLKVSLLLAASFAAARILRGAPALSRHRLWSGAFVGLLLLPMLAAALPEVRVATPAWMTTPAAPAAVTIERDAVPASAPAARSIVPPSRQAAADDESLPAESSSPSALPSAATLFAAAWIAGAASAFALLILSLWRARRVANASTLVDGRLRLVCVPS